MVAQLRYPALLRWLQVGVGVSLETPALIEKKFMTTKGWGKAHKVGWRYSPVSGVSEYCSLGGAHKN